MKKFKFEICYKLKEDKTNKYIRKKEITIQKENFNKALAFLFGYCLEMQNDGYKIMTINTIE